MSIHTRSVTVKLKISSPVENVWKAITEAEHLSNWFPVSAEASPGIGGTILLNWRDEFVWKFHIKDWQENRYLKLEYDNVRDSSLPEDYRNTAHSISKIMSVEYRLTPESGSTNLELVHDGFGTGPEWDTEYTDIDNGWNCELRSLKLYVEEFFEIKREVSWTMSTVEDKLVNVWPLLFSDKGFNLHQDLSGLKEGDECTIKYPDGQVQNGTLIHYVPFAEFSVRLKNLNDSILRIYTYGAGDKVSVSIFLKSYSMSELESAQHEKTLKKFLAELLSN